MAPSEEGRNGGNGGNAAEAQPVTEEEARAYLERHGVRELFERAVAQLVQSGSLPDDAAAFAADALLRGSASLPGKSRRSATTSSLPSDTIAAADTSSLPSETTGAPVAIVGIGCRYPAGALLCACVFSSTIVC
jgi:hypothetical protein